MTSYFKVTGPNFESLTVRALGLATHQERGLAGQPNLGRYFPNLDLRYNTSSQGPRVSGRLFSMRRARSDPIGHKTASHFSSTGISGEPRREDMRVLSPPSVGPSIPSLGCGERALILSCFGSPGIPVLLKCDAVLWPIGSLRARRKDKNSRMGCSL